MAEIVFSGGDYSRMIHIAELIFGEGDVYQPTFEEQSRRMRREYPRLPDYLIIGTKAWGDRVQAEALGGQAEPMGSTELIRRQA